MTTLSIAVGEERVRSLFPGVLACAVVEQRVAAVPVAAEPADLGVAAPKVAV